MAIDMQPLILGLEKPIYLSATGPIEDSTSEILGWTTTKPPYDNGSIDRGSVLLFSNISHEKDDKGHRPLEFIIIHVGPVPGEYPADFLEEEIESLTKEGALILLDLEDIDEMSIALGKVFTKYPNHTAGKELSFDATISVPRDLYIIMGPEEMRKSNAKIVTGEKVSLKHILDVYLTAVGQNLISK